MPLYQRLLQRIRGSAWQPAVIFVDGFGILHPRRCGSASHLGVLEGVVTVGVAKTLLAEDGLRERQVRAAAREGSTAPRHEEGWARELEEAYPGVRIQCLRGVSTSELLGAAVSGHAGSLRPVYVSIGHGMGLEAAVALTLQCSRHRIPEPIRQSDQRARDLARRWAADPPDPCPSHSL